MEDVTVNVLERCTYRALQQTAKSMGLPSNVKKTFLIEMIYAKKYSSPEHLNSIVERIREQRKLASKHRKSSSRKKKRVQGTEISSMSNQSPSITSTPQSTYVPYTQSTTHTIMQCNTSILNPLITKRAMNSDRVLRSYNNKLRRNLKYSILNINNTVMGVIKAQNTMKSSQVQERVCEWNTGIQQYRPVRALPQRKDRDSMEVDDYVLHQPRAIEGCSNQAQRVFDGSEDRQLVPVARSSNMVSKPQRRLSGIYPLKPYEETQYQPAPLVTYRRQDGRISKINALLQQQARHTPLTMIKNKMTQTTARRNLKPLVISLRDVIRNPDRATIQDIVNYKVEGSFSNSSTETAEESSNDREISTRNVETLNSYMGGSKGYVSTSRVFKARKPGPRCYTRPVPFRVSSDNTDNAEQNHRPMPRSIENSYTVTVDRTNRMNAIEQNKDYGIDYSAQKHSERNISEQNKRQYSTKHYNLRAIGNTGQRAYTYGTDTRNSDIERTNAMQYQNRNCLGPKVKDYQNRINNHGLYAIESQRPRYYGPLFGAQNVECQNTNKSYDTDTQNRYTNESYTDVYSKYIEERDTVKLPKRQGNMNLNDSMQNIDQYIQYRTNESSVNKNQNAVTNQKRAANIERDYPNMSALTDVYPENQSVTVTEASNEASVSEMAVYYHKKIRAEQVRSQRNSVCQESVPPEGSLPRIMEVFSQLSDPRYHHLTQPLYVDVGEGADNAKPCRGAALESVYNYKAAGLARPLSLHHEIATTANTHTVYCTPVITTAVPHASAPVYAQYRTDLYPRASQQHNIEAEQMPRLQDYLRMAAQEPGDMTCDEVLQQSPLSSSSFGSSLGADATLSTGPEMEDALDLISQDGDYMERIGMDVRAQCFLCNWAGPKTILEYHVRMNHPTEIFVRESRTWSHTIMLGAARDGVYLLSELSNRIYVVNVLCLGTSYLHANIMMLPKDKEPEPQPIYGRLTIYNKVTGEPYMWEGQICYPPLTGDETGSNRINMDQTGSSELNLDENMSNEQNLDLDGSDQTKFNVDKIELEKKRENVNKNESNKPNLDQQSKLNQIETDYKVDQINQTIGPNLEQAGSKTLQRDHTRLDGLNLNLTSLDLLPNSANLKLVNGEWEVKSSVKVVAGQPELDNIEIVIYVQIFD